MTVFTVHCRTRQSRQALWFTEPENKSIGRIDARTGAIAEFIVPDNAAPGGITMGLDVTPLFTTYDNQIDRIDPLTFVITANLVVDYPSPAGITAAPNGSLWFTNFNK